MPPRPVSKDGPDADLEEYVRVFLYPHMIESIVQALRAIPEGFSIGGKSLRELVLFEVWAHHSLDPLPETPSWSKYYRMIIPSNVPDYLRFVGRPTFCWIVSHAVWALPKELREEACQDTFRRLFGGAQLHLLADAEEQRQKQTSDRSVGHMHLREPDPESPVCCSVPDDFGCLAASSISGHDHRDAVKSEERPAGFGFLFAPPASEEPGCALSSGAGQLALREPDPELMCCAVPDDLGCLAASSFSGLVSDSGTALEEHRRLTICSGLSRSPPSSARAEAWEDERPEGLSWSEAEAEAAEEKLVEEVKRRSLADSLLDRLGADGFGGGAASSSCGSLRRVADAPAVSEADAEFERRTQEDFDPEAIRMAIIMSLQPLYPSDVSADTEGLGRSQTSRTQGGVRTRLDAQAISAYSDVAHRIGDLAPESSRTVAVVAAVGVAGDDDASQVFRKPVPVEADDGALSGREVAGERMLIRGASAQLSVDLHQDGEDGLRASVDPTSVAGDGICRSEELITGSSLSPDAFPGQTK